MGASLIKVGTWIINLDNVTSIDTAYKSSTGHPELGVALYFVLSDVNVTVNLPKDKPNYIPVALSPSPSPHPFPPSVLPQPGKMQVFYGKEAAALRHWIEQKVLDVVKTSP